MINCPICNTPFEEKTGRRPKKFCSDECKVRFWNVQKRVAENNKPENKERIEQERNTPAKPLSDIEKQFQELLKQKKDGNKT